MFFFLQIFFSFCMHEKKKKKREDNRSCVSPGSQLKKKKMQLVSVIFTASVL